MVDSLQVLTLQPLESSLPPQSIAYLTTDSFSILLGGTYTSSRDGPVPRISAPCFRFDAPHLHREHSSISISCGKVTIAIRDEDGIIQLRGRELHSDESADLRADDTVDLGYFSEYQGCNAMELSIRVLITSTPPPFVLASTMISTTATTLDHLEALQVQTRRLHGELETTRRRLQDAVDAAAAHICTPLPQPRPYGTLIADLRVRATDDAACTPSASPSSTSTSFSSEHSPNPLPSPPPVSPCVPAATPVEDWSARASSSASALPILPQSHSPPDPIGVGFASSTNLGTDLGTGVGIVTPLPAPVSHSDASSLTPSGTLPVSSTEPTSVLNSVLAPVPLSPSTSASVSSYTSPSVSVSIPSSTSVLTSVLGSDSSPPCITSLSTISAARLDSPTTSPPRSPSPPSAQDAVSTSPSTSVLDLDPSSLPTSKLTLELEPALSSTRTTPHPYASSTSSPRTFPSASQSASTSVLRTAASSASPPHSQTSSSPLATAASMASAPFDCALRRVRSAWITARRRLNAAAMPGQTPSSLPSVADSRATCSLDVAMSRVWDEWVRTREEVFCGTRPLELDETGSVLAHTSPATRRSSSRRRSGPGSPLTPSDEARPPLSRRKSSRQAALSSPPAVPARAAFEPAYLSAAPSTWAVTRRPHDAAYFWRVLIDGVHDLLPWPFHTRYCAVDSSRTRFSTLAAPVLLFTFPA
ncbi:hypothetical protein A4X13_0g4424 [Tilletia indica]|uniref:FHA domain-containing protein n=1 Tax=Tilletia indica TaxID=43049 RepID=A0A177T858_9BASI|nr:hypothetical protein A4X13_0g4424 [Tilletia indica]